MTMTDPVAIAAGLRRLADFIDRHPDDAGHPSVLWHIGYSKTAAEIAIANIVEAANGFRPPDDTQSGQAIVEFVGLDVQLCGARQFFGEEVETSKVVTEVQVFSRAEIIRRGRDAESQLVEADGPFG